MKSLLLVLLAIPVFGQVMPLQSESVKFHYGDDLRWADPRFDDGGWLDGNALASRDGHLMETWQWARYRFRVPQKFVDLVIGTGIPTLEVYVEGRRIGASGQFPPDRRDGPMRQSNWSIPADLAQPGRVLTIAFRMWYYPGRDLRRITVRDLAPSLQVYSAMEAPIYEARQDSLMWGRVWAFAITALLVLFLLLSGRSQWTGTEFWLLASYLFTNLITYALFIAGCRLPFGNSCFPAMTFFYPFAFALQLELADRFGGVRAGWWLRVVQVLNFVVLVARAWAEARAHAPVWLPAIGAVYQPLLFVNLSAAIAMALLQRAGDVSSRVLTWGLAIFFVGAAWPNSPLYIGSATFNNNIAGNILFGAILVAVQLYRLRQASTIAARLQGQFAAARSVQTMLLSGNPQVTPHYSVDPVYHPAEEVGGDFFRILSAPGDATLVVVGDVSGKGLRAAMLVSVTVGALLNRRSNEPGEVLAELNNALAGQMEGGFVTCCCALLQPDGRVTLANAGHPSPYRNSLEVDVPAGLPLGIVRDVRYESCTLRLGDHDRLTFVSDGVVEAAASDGELFGFERTRENSEKAAEEIAVLAHAWGQNDDITVVTVRRNA